MRYGAPYKGSKNAIAPWVVEHLPPAETFVDLFVGGKSKATERLFVQERFADEYRERMESGTTAPLFDTEED